MDDGPCEVHFDVHTTLNRENISVMTRNRKQYGTVQCEWRRMLGATVVIGQMTEEDVYLMIEQIFASGFDLVLHTSILDDSYVGLEILI